MVKELIAYLQTYCAFTEEECEVMQESFVFESINKKEFLVKANQVSTDFYFIMSGYLRTFYTTQEGEEITTDLFHKGEMVASMYSILKKVPAYEYIQCITDVKLFRISEAKFEELSSQNPKWLQLALKLMKGLLLKKEERINDFAKLNAHERYKKLLTQSPDIVQNVPVHYIASYLGVQPQSLSRIRALELNS
jgi:CRP-like cAMP-binding protein